MTFQEFLNKYPVGTKVDFDGAYGAQCVDLFRQYCKDVWNIPSYGKDGIGSIVGAKDLWLGNVSNLDKYLNKISLKDGKPGDIVVFSSAPGNPYGHVAVFLCFESNGNLRVRDQNGLEKDERKQGVREVAWRPDTVLGFLRKKEV